MAQHAFHTAIGLLAVNAVREFFSTHALAQSYRWSSDPAKRNLEIVEQWPETPRNFPLIVIDTVYGGDAERYLSDGADDLLVNGTFEGQYRSGSDNFDVRFSVNDYSKTGVDEIVELLIFGLKRTIERTIMEASLMNVYWASKSARSTGAGSRQYTDKELEYFVNISQPVKAHWFDEVVYDQKILTYLATVEHAKLDGSTTTFQIRED